MAMRTRRSPIDDRQFAVLFRDHRRLKDADRPDAGGKRRVGHFAGLDFAGIAGDSFQGAGIDASQFHLFSPGFVSSRVSSKTKPGEARAIRPGQRRRLKRRDSDRPAKRRDGPTLCGGRASRASSLSIRSSISYALFSFRTARFSDRGPPLGARSSGFDIVRP